MYEQDVLQTIADFTGTSNTNAVANSIGEWANSSLNWDGDIAEIIVYNRKLLASERTVVFNYLFNRYGAL